MKILILAESGFGKTTSIGPIPELGIKGLDSKKTFIITCTNKGLPIPGWKSKYILADPTKGTGNLVTNAAKFPDKIPNIINFAAGRQDIENIILDDANYIMQDHYMSKAMTTGFDVFKKIGWFMGTIFNAMDSISNEKNFIMMAHHEEFKNSNLDTISFRFKTVGKMVQDYSTPEGKFEVVLFGKQRIIETDGVKGIEKLFVTNFDGQFPAKSPYGMFKDIYIPNDLGLVIDTVNKFAI